MTSAVTRLLVAQFRKDLASGALASSCFTLLYYVIPVAWLLFFRDYTCVIAPFLPTFPMLTSPTLNPLSSAVTADRLFTTSHTALAPNSIFFPSICVTVSRAYFSGYSAFYRTVFITMIVQSTTPAISTLLNITIASTVISAALLGHFCSCVFKPTLLAPNAVSIFHFCRHYCDHTYHHL